MVTSTIESVRYEPTRFRIQDSRFKIQDSRFKKVTSTIESVRYEPTRPAKSNHKTGLKSMVRLRGFGIIN